MARAVLWVFLLAGLISPMVNGQFTQDYETTDDGLDDTDDDDETADDADTNDDYSDVFNDYFDDEMRVVDVDQDVAIKACVSNSDALVNKIDSAYNKCFKDFEDWSEFQKNNVGNDKDNDGLSDEYEADEACFYKKMGWVVNNEADKEAIKKDFENLNSNSVKNGFVSSIDACSGWNGKFSGRKKRDAEEDSWALSLARERRAAQRNEKQRKGRGKNVKKGRGKNGQKVRKNGKVKGKGRGKNGKPKNGKPKRRNGRGKNGKPKNGKPKRRNTKNVKKNKNKKNRPNNRNGKGRRGNRKDKGRNKQAKKNKKEKDDKKKERNGKSKGKGKGSKNDKEKNKTIKQLLPESVYNQLWCYELSVEKALEECVEAKILP